MKEGNKHPKPKEDTNTKGEPKPLGLGPNLRALALSN